MSDSSRGTPQGKPKTPVPARPASTVAILRDGVAKGEFKVKDLDAAAQAVLNATARFHHPHHVKEAGGRNQDAEIKAVLGLILAGLKSGTL